MCVVCFALRVRARCLFWECNSPLVLDVVNNLQTNNLFRESTSLFCLGHVLPLFSESISLKFSYLQRFTFGDVFLSLLGFMLAAAGPSKGAFKERLVGVAHGRVGVV